MAFAPTPHPPRRRVLLFSHHTSKTVGTSASPFDRMETQRYHTVQCVIKLIPSVWNTALCFTFCVGSTYIHSQCTNECSVHVREVLLVRPGSPPSLPPSITLSSQLPSWCRAFDFATVDPVLSSLHTRVNVNGKFAETQVML